MLKGRSLVAAVAAVGMLAAAGCSADGDEPQSSASSSAAMPAAVPGTYERSWDWKAPIAAGSWPLTTDYGVFTVIPQSTAGSSSGAAGSSLWRVALTDPSTGKRVWRSATISSGVDERPKMLLVRQGGQDWLVLWSKVADDQTQLVTIDPSGSGGTSKALTHTEVVKGAREVPEVQATNGGVLVNGDAAVKKPYLYWPETGAKTTYDDGPVRGKARGVPKNVYSDGWVVAFPGGGFAYATEQGGWDSTDVAPPRADPRSGSLLGVARGVLFSVWRGAAPGSAHMLVAQDIRTGRVLGLVAEDSRSPLAKVVQKPVVSADRAWAAMGGYTLDLRRGKGTFRDVNGAYPTFIHRDAIYYKGGVADPGQTAPASASPASVPRGSVPPAGAVFTLDARSGATVSSRVKGVLVGVDSAGHGLFIFPDSDRGGSVLYSAPSK